MKSNPFKALSDYHRYGDGHISEMPYHTLTLPKDVGKNKSDHVGPFSSIDKELEQFFHNKYAHSAGAFQEKRPNNMWLHRSPGVKK